jgi:hypothetical protein
MWKTAFAKDTDKASSKQDDFCYISAHPCKTGNCQFSQSQVLILFPNPTGFASIILNALLRPTKAHEYNATLQRVDQSYL